MEKKVLFVFLILFQVWHKSFGQADSILSLSLDEAKKYALSNSPIIKSSELDIESAKKKIWETTAIGLPQASAKYAYSYIITLPDIYKKFAVMGGTQQGATTMNLDDLKTSSTLDITVSQLIFSGSYLVGLQTSRVYKSLSELALSKSQQDLAESVTQSYVLVLVVKENKRIIDSMYNNLKSIYESMKAIYAQGLIEETDVDQLEITVNTLKNNADLLERQTDISERLLKFQIGYPLDKKISLTDSISYLLSNFENNEILLKNFNVENYVDYKLLETQKRLMKLNLMLNKSAFLPEVAGYYQHDKNFNNKAISFTPPDIVGISVNIPIFSSGMRLAKVSQARISYEKAILNQEQSAKSLQISYEDSKSKYLSSLQNYETAKKNLQLAEKIYNRSLIKFKEGVITSIELTQVQNQYLQSQTNLYNSIIELTNAKLKLEKLLSSL